MSSSKPIELAYCPAGCVSSKEWSTVEFPGVSEADMTKLLDVCSVVSYGHMGKNVVDIKLTEVHLNWSKFPDLCYSYSSENPVNCSYSSWVNDRIDVYVCDGFFKLMWTPLIQTRCLEA